MEEKTKPAENTTPPATSSVGSDIGIALKVVGRFLKRFFIWYWHYARWVARKNLSPDLYRNLRAFRTTGGNYRFSLETQDIDRMAKSQVFLGLLFFFPTVLVVAFSYYGLVHFHSQGIAYSIQFAVCILALWPPLIFGFLFGILGGPVTYWINSPRGGGEGDPAANPMLRRFAETIIGEE